LIAPDVNVLVYAHRLDAPRHRECEAFLEARLAGPEPFGLSTNPTPLPVALSFVDVLLGAPNCRRLDPGSRHWALVSQLCRAAKATGKLVADAQHAAIALEHGCTWVTCDRDFARFAPHGISWQLL
jgi:uncharacterized protein